jgi:hypothetical protein
VVRRIFTQLLESVCREQCLHASSLGKGIRKLNLGAG